MAMIFEDASRRRWRAAVAVFILAVLAAAGVVALSVAGLLVPTSLPDVLPRRTSVPTDSKTPFLREAKPAQTPEQKKLQAAIRLSERRRRNRLIRNSKAQSNPLPENASVAFLAHDDPNGPIELEKHIASIDVVVPDWFDMPGPGCDIVSHVDEGTRKLLARSNVIVLPRLVNLSNGEWRTGQIEALLSDDDNRQCVVAEITNRLIALKADGLNLDLEELAPEDSEPYLEFLVELRKALHEHDMRLTVDIAVNDPVYDIEYIGNVADAVMVMAYDEHFPTSAPGPIASDTWFREAVQSVQARLPVDRLCVVLGAYGYDWEESTPQKP